MNTVIPDVDSITKLIVEHLKGKGLPFTHRSEPLDEAHILFITPKEYSDLKAIREEVKNLGITSVRHGGDLKIVFDEEVNCDLDLGALRQKIEGGGEPAEPTPATSNGSLAKEFIPLVQKCLRGLGVSSAPAVGEKSITLNTEDQATEVFKYLKTDGKETLVEKGVSVARRDRQIFFAKAKTQKESASPAPAVNAPKKVSNDHGDNGTGKVDVEKADRANKACRIEMRRAGFEFKNSALPKNAPEFLSAYFYFEDKKGADKFQSFLAESGITYTHTKKSKLVIKIHHSLLEKLVEELQKLPAVVAVAPKKAEKKEKRKYVKKNQDKSPISAPSVSVSSPKFKLPLEAPATLEVLVDSMGGEAVLLKLIEIIVEKKVAARINEKLEKRVEERVAEIKKNLMEFLNKG